MEGARCRGVQGPKAQLKSTEGGMDWEHCGEGTLGSGYSFGDRRISCVVSKCNSKGCQFSKGHFKLISAIHEIRVEVVTWKQYECG